MERNAEIEILDCTIRDGGYYNNWDFDDSIIDQYVENISYLPISYIEVGYRSLPCSGFRGLYFNIPPKRIDEIKLKTSIKVAVMVDLKIISSKEQLDVLLLPVSDKIDLLRLTLNPQDDPSRVLSLISHLRGKFQFKIALNMMYASKWNLEERIFEFLKNDIGIDYFYLVDSYGGLTQRETVYLVDFLKSILNPNIKLGFHGHNNLELALANTIAVIEKLDIVDSTVLGMGRGAGNLKLELLLVYLKKYYSKVVQLNYLQKLTGLFQNLLDQYNWGTNLPYMIAGVNSFPQKDIMNWVQTKVISFETMVNSISGDITTDFEFETKHFSHTDQLLLVGGGDSIGKYVKYILKYLYQNPEIQIIFSSPKYISMFKEVSNKKYLSIIGDEGKDLDLSCGNLNLFLPSSHRNIKINLTVKGDTIVSRLPENNIFLTDYPNHLSNCANLISILNPNKVYVVGYDGYISGTYFDNGLYDTNNSIFQSLSKLLGFELLSLTPSRYKTLKEYSLFFLLN